MKRVIVRVLFLHELSCSKVGLHDVEAGRNVAQTERCAFCGSLRCGYGLACDIAYENSLAGVRRPIGLRPPSNRIIIECTHSASSRIVIRIVAC